MGWNNQLMTLLVIGTGGNYTGLFVYQGTPGPGNLVFSIAATAGTDPYGNTYLAGETVGAAPATQLQLISNGGTGMLNFLLNNAAITNGFLEGINGGTFGEILLQGPALIAANENDYVSVFMVSNNGSVFPANMNLEYTDAGGIIHGYLNLGAEGVSISAGFINAGNPGTGTSATNPATTETWHALAVSGTGYTVGSPVPAYKLYPDNTAGISGEVNVAAGSAGAVFATLPLNYRPLTGKVFPVSINAGTPAVSGAARVVIASTGAMSLASPATVNAFTISLDLIRFPLDY